MSFVVRKRQQREIQLQKQIVDLLTWHGVFAVHIYQPYLPPGHPMHFARHPSATGMPDIIGSHDFGAGVQEPWGMEIKQPGRAGRVTQKQAAWHERAKEAGWHIFVIESGDQACLALGLDPNHIKRGRA